LVDEDVGAAPPRSERPDLALHPHPFRSSSFAHLGQARPEVIRRHDGLDLAQSTGVIEDGLVGIAAIGVQAFERGGVRREEVGDSLRQWDGADGEGDEAVEDRDDSGTA
jgi:hypothetical protein